MYFIPSALGNLNHWNFLIPKWQNIKPLLFGLTPFRIPFLVLDSISTVLFLKYFIIHILLHRKNTSKWLLHSGNRGTNKVPIYSLDPKWGTQHALRLTFRSNASSCLKLLNCQPSLLYFDIFFLYVFLICGFQLGHINLMIHFTEVRRSGFYI